ncbi:hypothetical protein EHI8A_154340 [Entamoeba histolytica HM-1:IMSS-B]|uniref:Uncharacterized protein n=4 Tax=Entamoeba histolytica TaxID=5759 RepID=C4MAV6_ENTH1|nr:hypothetical protein EHI_085840 [Entamoeba histolytica HM-1:IMSS]EAL42615.1 hypothetical protein EHI_085840 [Entamoeba histolytica HM-1:IMSS]EMH74332.1 hypothetical protein EHI8A_154340 [Entamoeba histolytica HM-1:IMSS-B]EMS12400.1 hypothetical protein KM1_124830 [Entamoeba histolytica HM-3:IMSS]GAT98993.1 hypothetical protein CL6EHI_085840 [Entamoeba histolytica]|eukprot:XP_647999.1 hypothetical protein EHI_085840 [Entamoeba histolytica HM-1:IMSS]
MSLSESESDEVIVGQLPQDRKSLLDGEEDEDGPIDTTTNIDKLKNERFENVPQDESAVIEPCKYSYEGEVIENEEWDWKNEKFSSDDETNAENKDYFNFEESTFGYESLNHQSDGANERNDTNQVNEEQHINEKEEDKRNEMINKAIDEYLNDDSYEECMKADGH